jgi:C4-dicarboxylate-specific signal transduction histidine kinase
VQDIGFCLAANPLEQMFSVSCCTKPGGMGMGLLSISRSIVEAHGGRLEAARDPARGARFQFTVPVVLANADA